MSPAPSGSFLPVPFGLRAVRVFPLVGESVGAAVPMSNNQKLTFTEAETFVELRGDDALQYVHGKGPQVDWDLTAGGVSLDAVKVMYAGTIVESGTWSNGTGTGIRTYTKKTTDARPYFRIEGQAISDSGGDFHVIIYRAKSNGNLTGAMDENAFWLTGAKGIGLPRISDGVLWTMVQNERATVLTGGSPPVFVNSTPPSAPSTVAFSYTFTATGDPTLVYALASGTLPTGLTLATSTGILSGTPTVPGSYNYTISVTNSLGQATANVSQVIT